MKFPDGFTILRTPDGAPGSDEYGNPHAAGYASVGTFKGFRMGGSARRKDEVIFTSPGTDVRAGDRLAGDNGFTYAVEGAPEMLRSPSRDIFLSISIRRLPDV